MFKISIIGRPNVGKSTLFNRLSHSRSSIVHEQAGITRDRKSLIIEIGNRQVELIDTGGIIFEKNHSIQYQITKQALFALEESNLIIFVLDINELLPLDLDILNLLRKSSKNYIIAINKIDNKKKEELLLEFYSRGINDFVPVSAIHNSNISLLERTIENYLPLDAVSDIPLKDIPKICIAGKPNVGKSTLINKLLNKERLIVSDMPGTTRDSIDTVVYYYKRPYILIDTAGLRKKSRSKNSIEAVFNTTAINSIERSDIVLLLIDSSKGFTNQDHKIINIVEKKGKCLIIGLNKWDLLEKDTMTFKNIVDDIYHQVPNWGRFPIISFSALDKSRITHIFKIIDKINTISNYRIPTAKLNKFLNSFLSDKTSNLVPKGNVKFYYAANIGIKPHKFILWTNHPKMVKLNIERYLINKIRGEYKLDGVFIDLIFKERTKKV